MPPPFPTGHDETKMPIADKVKCQSHIVVKHFRENRRQQPNQIDKKCYTLFIRTGKIEL